MPLTLVDAHVHIYPCYDGGAFFDRAYDNFQSAIPASRPKETGTGVLLLTESVRFDYFADLSRLAAAREPAESYVWGGWRPTPTGEPCSLRLANGSRELFLVAGRQVATAEDLEVLMLGTTERVPDGLPIAEVLERAAQLGVVHVIPWGAGKWMFARGRLLSHLIATTPTRDFFLGDESARPVFWPTPSHFAEAARRGIRMLPGTDPLPFDHEVARAGRFGFWLEGAVDAGTPAASLQAALRDPARVVHPYGRLESPGTFLYHQVALQLRKRMRGRRPYP